MVELSAVSQYAFTTLQFTILCRGHTGHVHYLPRTIQDQNSFDMFVSV